MERAEIKNGVKEMIRNHSKINVRFENGASYVTIYEGLTNSFVNIEIDASSLEDAADYPYYLEIETFSYDDFCSILFRRYYKTESEAVNDIKLFKVGTEYVDDVVIKNVKGPFKV